MTLSFTEIGKGVHLCFLGTILAIKTGKIRRYFLKSSILLIISMSILYFILNAVIFLPLYILSFRSPLTSLFVDQKNQSNDNYKDFIDNLRKNFDFAPMVGLYLIRYLYPYPMNNIFLVSLKKSSEEYYEVLKNSKYKIHYKSEIKFFLKRSLLRYSNLAILYLMSKTPYVGHFAFPIGSIILTKRLLGYPLSVTFALLPIIFSFSNKPIFHCIKAIYGCRGLTRELLEPYFYRLGFKPKDRQRFFIGKESITLGFSMFFYILIKLPIFGPVFFVIAQSAITVLLIQISDVPENKNKLE